ncbi:MULTISPECIES: hypothetical protein [unclassified Herbaspirillum]|uniref:hypothetical protein n=1 Tax=unclassified Herbaspirillum TaxID=2624150 RepID=UPI00114E024B|nr:MULTISPECIES: hypothetical protein [unclassified Herbaspirillum]MBB5391388.1 chromosome segregation ATPase [Herbaspirillum sp. SJZ102]TQK12927.1 hypothetical protein FB599_0334 [Herbaspirillum sp. SJZ130]TQK14931.1 hypothetical protein FB598_0272 [Herbaspirillum sp. SJZ106]TWC67286.1 hypothetical protein FB597_10496 [Herbaspirillum sp. SJZ099]
MVHPYIGNFTPAYPANDQMAGINQPHANAGTRQPPQPVVRKPVPVPVPGSGLSQAMGHRARGNFIEQVRRDQTREGQQRSHGLSDRGTPRVTYGVASAPSGDRDELHFWSPLPAAARSASPVDDSTPEGIAAAIETLLRARKSGIPVLDAPRPQFVTGTHHLTPASQQRLAEQFAEIKTLRKKISGYLDKLDMDSQLVQAMQTRGLSVADSERQIEDLVARCNERSDAIAALRAHDMVQVSSHPAANWLAQQLMGSQETRDTLNIYLSDTEPLELQVNRNRQMQLRRELSGMSVERERNGMAQQALERKIEGLRGTVAALERAVALPPGSQARPQPELWAQLMSGRAELAQAQHQLHQLVEQGKQQWQAHEQLKERVDTLARRITELERRVPPVRIPADEAASEMTTEAVARYLSRQYEPLRPHLHALREELERLLPEDGAATPERRQLVILRKQIGQTLEAAGKAEYGYVTHMLEQAHANGLAPGIVYSPQAAKSLSTRMVHYEDHSAIRREPIELTKARSHYVEQQERHRQAYVSLRQAKRNAIESGRPVEARLVSDTQDLERQMAMAKANYVALQAVEDAEMPALQAMAQRNRELRQLSEHTLYSMLDDKLTSLRQQGYASLAAVPPPKPAIDDMDYLAQRYHVRLSQLEQAPEENRQHIAALKEKLAFLAPVRT